MGESEAEFRQKVMKWKSRMEAKGLKANVGKTKVMTVGEAFGTIDEFGAYLFKVGKEEKKGVSSHVGGSSVWDRFW